MSRSVVAVVSCVALFPWAVLAAAWSEVEATGEAAIVQKNRPQARDRAIEDALRQAVAQACGTLVASHTEVKNNQLVSDKILAQAKGYVASYDLLSEQEAGGVVRVTVRAKVGADKLASDLAAIGLTLARKGMPRLAVLVAEQRIDQVVPTAWWGEPAKDAKLGGNIALDQRLVENTLLDAWTQAGFTFIDTEALAGKARASGIVSPELNAEQAQRLGQATGADVLITGTGFAKRARDVAELVGDTKGELKQVSCTSTVSVRAYNTDTGEILATSTEGKAAFNVDATSCGRDALVSATQTLAVDLQKKLLEKWTGQLGGAGLVVVNVTGLDSLGALTALKQGLLSRRGVRQVDQKRFGKGAAQLDVRLEGSAESLAQELEGKKLAKRTLKVTGVSSNQIDLEVSK